MLESCWYTEQRTIPNCLQWLEKTPDSASAEKTNSSKQSLENTLLWGAGRCAHAVAVPGIATKAILPGPRLIQAGLNLAAFVCASCCHLSTGTGTGQRGTAQGCSPLPVSSRHRRAPGSAEPAPAPSHGAGPAPSLQWGDPSLPPQTTAGPSPQQEEGFCESLRRSFGLTGGMHGSRCRCCLLLLSNSGHSPQPYPGSACQEIFPPSGLSPQKFSIASLHCGQVSV